jgi:hypothetical protein
MLKERKTCKFFYLHANFTISRGVEFARHVTLVENNGQAIFENRTTLGTHHEGC